MEKTCCLTSEEGFEFSAPMLLLSEVRDASTMMQHLGEVGAQGLAERNTRYDGCSSDRRGMLDAPESRRHV